MIETIEWNFTKFDSQSDCNAVRQTGLCIQYALNLTMIFVFSCDF